jgi:hypothetical protein
MEYSAFGFGIMVGLIFAMALSVYKDEADLLIRAVASLSVITILFGAMRAFELFGVVGILAHVAIFMTLVAIMAFVAGDKRTGKS